MEATRYFVITNNSGIILTNKELDEGWFFCCNWDNPVRLMHKLDKASTKCVLNCNEYLENRND